MPWHLYLLPVIGTGTKQDPLQPKYLDSIAGSSSAKRYGYQPVMLVAADVSDADDTTIKAAADATKIPDNLDGTIGAALAVVQGALENVNIPSGWVTSGMTYRTLLRTVNGFFAFLSRYSAVANTTALVLGGAVTLDTRMNQLSANVRNNLSATATDMGLDISGIAGTTLVRVVLKNVADQFGQQPFTLGGVSI